MFPSRKLSLLFIIIFSIFSTHLQANTPKTPSDVYNKVDYAFRMMEKILHDKRVNDLAYPTSHEQTVKPMHVYELHVSTITELYKYAIKQQQTPPPLTFSSPITYTPTDVYQLSETIVTNIESIYHKNFGYIDIEENSLSKKTPNDVYGKLYKLYYSVARLNGAEKVSPDAVYAQAKRAKEDLKLMLLTLSKRLGNNKIKQKRLLVTATYGMHPNGSTMSTFEDKKKPKDVIESAFNIRKKLNTLRNRYQMEEILSPDLSFYQSVSPADVFLQTQFIIAEINLLKSPLKILHSTNIPIDTSDKTPSDVYQEMKHISYLLDRLISI